MGKIDIGDWVVLGLGVCVLLVVALMAGVLMTKMVDWQVTHAYAAEDAAQQCRGQGAVSYVSFEKALFSDKALGVKCEYPTKNYDVDGAPAVVLIGGERGV